MFALAPLSYLARWQAPLRLFVVGTYRPAEALRHKHPLTTVQGELAGQGLCIEVALPFLSESAVTEYLQQRAPNHTALGHLASTCYRQTAGLPLFMVVLVDEWLAQRQGSEQNGGERAQRSAAALSGQAPERLRQLVSVQMERMTSREQRLLEAASVAGFEFSTVEVAAALAADEVTTEEHCEQLARRPQFLRPAGVSEWPARNRPL